MADDCRVPPDRQDWDKLLKDLNLTPRQGQGSGRGGRGGGQGGNRGGGSGGGTGQQHNWQQRQQSFQGNPGMYSIQQQQVLSPPGMTYSQQVPRGGGGGQCPPPNMTRVPLGQQQQPPPPPSPVVPQPGGLTGTYVLDPSSQLGGTYADFNMSPFSAVGTGHSPGGSASTHHDPFALLRDKRRLHRLYGQINTINALGLAAARTRPTLLVQLGRTTIEALVDTGASATVIKAKTFAQVADKDKVRLDTHSNQLGLTGATKHPLEIVGVYKI